VEEMNDDSEKNKQLVYTPSPTGDLFHRSHASIKGVRGPIGSGKSVMCVAEIHMRILAQEPYNGVRYSRWAVVRDTYPLLEATTMKTWSDWIPEFMPNGQPYCKINHARPPTALIDCMSPKNDGTKIHAEIFFLALDRDEDEKKLLSLELTGVWVNEARTISKHLIDMAYSRTLGRYPPKRWVPATWYGMLMDTNPCDSDDDVENIELNWWYKLAEIVKPVGYDFFAQPPAIVPLKYKDKDGKVTHTEYRPNDGTHGYAPAENVENLNLGYDYWLKLTAAKDPEWIKIYCMGQYGATMSGKPVYPEYNDSLHFVPQDLTLYGGIPLIVGIDFGRTPAAAICQLSPRGQLRIIDEIVTRDMGTRTFVNSLLKPMLFNKYAGVPYVLIGDPAGDQKGQSDETTCFDEMRNAGLKIQAARTNTRMARREALAGFMSREIQDGHPWFLVGNKCPSFRKGCMGGYHYRKLNVAGRHVFSDEPEKNIYSHICEAAEYAALEAESSASGRFDSVNQIGQMSQNTKRRPVITASAKGWT
jgi:hypothetical protein